jgi:2-polyprenyl-3-methyl-5-hydroxy-6-metoxy-1,4-benzoquinol methylase
MSPDIRSILTIPQVYRLFVSLIRQKRELYINDYVRPQPGQRILDIGCGPGDVLEYMPACEYVGIDHNPKYIEAAQARFGNKGKFKCQDVSDVIVSEPHSYDIVMANGLLHHLDDREAAHLLSMANSTLKPGGYLVTFDGCFTPRQSLVKQFLLRMDRGKHVRWEAEYLRLARTAFKDVTPFIREDFYSIPYTIIVMKAVAAKPSGMIDRSHLVASSGLPLRSRQ